jgi:hypothetical protein
MIFRKAVTVAFVSSFIMGATALTISVLLIKQSERRWCATLTTLTEGYTAPASTPPSDRGVRLAGNLRDLRRDYHCD